MAKSILKSILVTGIIGISIMSTNAFSLLGPLAPWMAATNGLGKPGDIGGPMEIGSDYRWNVPVVTYGFDPSFVDYFGTNGVAAVQSAIQILNDLPPASDVTLTNYPFLPARYNPVAQALYGFDVKSTALGLLLEQMGLTQPTRYVYALKGWNPNLFGYSSGQFEASISGTSPNITETVNYPYSDPGTNILSYLIGRNYDPETLQGSSTVNGAVYFGHVFSSLNSPLPWGGNNDVIPALLDPFDSNSSAVADLVFEPGLFYSGLSADDVGGLRFLLWTNNVHFETLLPDVQVINTNSIVLVTNTIFPFHYPRPPRAHGPPMFVRITTNVVSSHNILVNGAWRPGVEKITLVPQPSGPLAGTFLPMTNRFADTYLSNGIALHQAVQRATTRPDILFSVVNSDIIFRTGTTNWINNAASNGNATGEGPGVIPPQINIAFSKMGPTVETDDGGVLDIINESWASFDGSTNAPIVYPDAVATTNSLLAVHLYVYVGGGIAITNQILEVPAPIGGQVGLFVSNNQVDWRQLTSVTNTGTAVRWLHHKPDNTPEFFRVVPQ